MIFFARNGDHLNDSLTKIGKKAIGASAVATAQRISALYGKLGKTIVLVTSPILRAFRTGDIYHDVFRADPDTNRIIRLQPDPRLSFVSGLNNAIKSKSLPAYGKECMRTWYLLEDRGCQEINIDPWKTVAARAKKAIDDIHLTFPEHIIVVISHGGVIEPLVCSLTPRVVLGDLSSAAVVHVNPDGEAQKIFNPTKHDMKYSGMHQWENAHFFSLNILD